jgi:tRNA G46 methylase TrmB
LKKNGIFYFKTDWSHYYQESSKILLDDKNWLILDESDLTSILKAIPITSFERKALKAQRDLKKIILKKIS